MKDKILDTVMFSLSFLLLTPILICVVYFVILPYFSARQALGKLNDELDQIPIPENSSLISEYATTWCCGNGNHPETDLIVTKFYRSSLSKEEVRNFYEGLSEAQPTNLVFVDEAIEDNPDRRVYSPCDYKLFEGHEIPEVLPANKVLFIIYGEGLHTDPRASYCS
jgi:hypothetical protein